MSKIGTVRIPRTLRKGRIKLPPNKIYKSEREYNRKREKKIPEGSVNFREHTIEERKFYSNFIESFFEEVVI